MTTAATARLAIIGLDGADWTLLRPLMDAGVMPSLRAAVERGVRGRLESVYPTNSMSAWTSLLTGVNPGKHGVFDFVRRTPTPFKTLVTNSSAIRAPTLPEVLTADGLRTCMLDMPPLYPPFEINGVMLGGIGAVDLESGAFSYPREAAQRVKDAAGGFHPDVGWVGKHGHEDELIEELIALAENRGRIAEYLLGEGPWDLFCAVFVAPDRAQHVFWREVMEHGPRYDDAVRFYRALDDAFGRVLERIDTTQTDLLIVSDHGFRTFYKTFNVNQVLLQTGLLQPELMRAEPGRGRIARARRKVRRALPWRARSIAFSDVSEGVSINLQGRERWGDVAPADYERARREVAQAILSFRDPEDGAPVIKRIINREDYFSGPFADEAPDLVLECHEGYGHNNALDTVMFRWQYCQGIHSLNGIIVGMGPHFREPGDAPDTSIMDVMPTALSLLGVAHPPGLDGRVAGQLLGAPVESKAGIASVPSRREEPGAYSEEEEERVRERLRALGYIE